MNEEVEKAKEVLTIFSRELDGPPPGELRSAVAPPSEFEVLAAIGVVLLEILARLEAQKATK